MRAELLPKTSKSGPNNPLKSFSSDLMGKRQPERVVLSLHVSLLGSEEPESELDTWRCDGMLVKSETLRRDGEGCFKKRNLQAHNVKKYTDGSAAYVKGLPSSTARI